MDEYVDPELKRALKRQAKADKARQAQDDAVVQSLMATPAGRAWMRAKLERCHIFSITFAGEKTHTSAFADGERNVGLILFSDIMRACPEMYIQMMKDESYGGRTRDKLDPDDDRNWDGDQWIGDGPAPDQ